MTSVYNRLTTNEHKSHDDINSDSWDWFFLAALDFGTSINDWESKNSFGDNGISDFDHFVTALVFTLTFSTSIVASSDVVFNFGVIFDTVFDDIVDVVFDVVFGFAIRSFDGFWDNDNNNCDESSVDRSSKANSDDTFLFEPLGLRSFALIDLGSLGNRVIDESEKEFCFVVLGKTTACALYNSVLKKISY